MIILRSAVLAIASLSLLTLFGGIGSAQAWQRDQDGWSMSGAVVLPRTGEFEEGTRSSSPACPECVWKVVQACKPEKNCAPWLICPQDKTRYTYHLSRGGPFSMVGTACLGDEEPGTTTVVFGSRMRERLRQSVPPLAMSCQPQRYALVRLPVVCASGQVQSLSRSDRYLGHGLQLEAQAEWVWNWGDGSSLRTANPGSRWPDTSVSHAYANRGLIRVVVRSEWRAQFRIDGSSWIEVDGGPIVQRAQAGLDVREARARLVDPRS